MKLKKYYEENKGTYHHHSQKHGDSTSTRMSCLIEKPTEAFQLQIQSKSRFLKDLYPFTSPEEIKRLASGLFAEKKSFSKYYFSFNGFAKLPMVRSEFITCYFASGEEFVDFPIPDETLGTVALRTGREGDIWQAGITLNTNVDLQLQESIITKILRFDKGLESHYGKDYLIKELYNFKKETPEPLLHVLGHITQEDMYKNYYALELEITTSSEPIYREDESDWVFEIESLIFTS